MRSSRWVLFGIIALALCVVIAVGIYFIGRSALTNVVQVGPTATTAQQGSITPGLPQASLDANVPKPEPVADYFHGCPPSGDGGDPVLNTLKNRIDEANYWQPATVASVLSLTWPSGIEQKPRSRWSAADRRVIAEREGTPLQVEGYLVDVKKMSPESCNCHAVDYVDFHVWLVDDPLKSRAQSIVIEVSPRTASYHSAWTLTNIRNIVRNKQKVRISGWLLMDPEHPDQIGKTRSTIWEIHPVMQIETQKSGGWVPLDNGTTGIHSGPTLGQTLPTVVPESTATTPRIQITGRQDNTTIKITNVFYDGVKGSTEPDEYVEITNTGSQPVDITDWVLLDPKGDDEYKWESFTIQPGQVIKVYTNEVHPDSGGFTFGSRQAIWANSGGVAELYDSDKVLVSRYAYGSQR
jgi:hypothetical protein